MTSGKKGGSEKINRYGQTFLIDANIADKIVNSAEISPSDTVIEIGPGQGVLTQRLLPKAGKLIAIEIDSSLCRLLEKKISQISKNFILINSDFLKLKTGALAKHLQPYSRKTTSHSHAPAPCIKFISNLPYYISSPIIEKVLMMKNWSVAVFMVQKEFADRIFSKPGTKQYSSLTLFVHFYAEAKKLFNVSRHCFRPVPSVDSTVIMLKRRPLSKRQLSVSGVMFKLIRGAFTHRRKTMLNSLKISLRTPWVLPAAAGRVPVEQLLREAFARNEINPSARPEEISPEKFFSLSLDLKRKI